MSRLENRNNILSFPKDENARFDAAIDLYATGKFSVALNEAIALIDEGYAHANTLAGGVYEKGGDGVDQDYAKAKFYYQMAVDTVGATEAWLALGRMHYFGKGMRPDYEKAYYYYSVVEKDSENGNIVANLMLGKMYLEGKGVVKDLKKARDYFSKAADMGSVFALAYQGVLEKECGNFFKSMGLRLKAVYRALVIKKRNPSDVRLRRI